MTASTFSKITTLLLLLGNVALISIAQMLLKNGAIKITSLLKTGLSLDTLLGVVTNPSIVGGTIFYALSLVFWIYLITKIPLSFAYPIMSLSYVAVMSASVLFFGESVKSFQWLGATLIIIGTSFIFAFK